MEGLHPAWSLTIFRGYQFQRHHDAVMEKIHVALHDALLLFKKNCDAGLASINI